MSLYVFYSNKIKTKLKMWLLTPVSRLYQFLNSAKTSGSGSLFVSEPNVKLKINREARIVMSLLADWWRYQRVELPIFESERRRIHPPVVSEKGWTFFFYCCSTDLYVEGESFQSPTTSPKLGTARYHHRLLSCQMYISHLAKLGP